MKKTVLLNSQVSEVIARMGHGDLLVIGDAGMPIPREVWRIDLALTRGVPGFVETLQAVLSELEVGEIILAEETQRVSPHIWQAILNEVGDVPRTVVSHAELKEKTKGATACIRTGEYTPYANVILVAGVVF